MSEQHTNLDTVRRGYEAFGRGDIDALLSVFHEDVEWITPGPEDLPTAGTRRGHDQVREFFSALNEVFEIQRFEPKRFVADGDTVIALGDETARVRATGRVLDTLWAHAFTFRNGKVSQFTEYLDTAAVVTEIRSVQAAV